MNEESIVLATEESFDVDAQEVITSSINPEDLEQVVDIQETVDVVDVKDVEEISVAMEESVGWVGGDSTHHYSLHGRDDPNQHTIGAITGLRETLDDIERIKTVYADKLNVANYYEWEDGGHDECGYFVSIVPGASTIKICDGSDIFGVSVDTAGFIGGQDEDSPRNSSYGLIATSGLVNVRCELGIEVDDHVVSNARGIAQKSESNHGYKVLAKVIKYGVEYVIIALGVQADIVDDLGMDVNVLKNLVSANEKNIMSAINIANQAYNQANNIDASNKDMSAKVNDALESVDKVVSDIEDLNDQVSSATLTAVQAKSIAESAATSATSMRDEAIKSANDAAAKVGDLTKSLEPLTNWVDSETGNVGVSYLVNYIDNGLATKSEIEKAEDELEHAVSAIQQNAKSLQSLVVSIDKYSVGERSTAYGLTLEQAISILEDGIIYAPTDAHTEEYEYTDENQKLQKYSRTFTPQYLYMWGKLNGVGPYRWITIDKNYQPTDEVNDSAKSVYFTTTEPIVGDNFAYWYTNGDIITDKNGNINTYTPYTLYKWDADSWIAVATLRGNVNARAMSQVRQTANEFAAEVVNARGDYANLGARITDTVAEVQTITEWTKDEKGDKYNLATIKQTADDAVADIALVVQEKDGAKVVNAASIVAAINEDGSNVGIDADRITMTGTTTFLQPGDVGKDGATVISGDRITTGQIDANKVKVVNLQASSIIVTGSGGNNQTVSDALADTLVSSTIYYALSTSTKNPPNDDAWQETPPEKERRKYMWQKTVNVYGDGTQEESVVCIAGADGDGPIVVEIKSSAGTIYINSDIRTTLSARVLQNNEDITDEFPDSAFRWEKYDMYGVKDTVWSYLGKTVAVNNLDIYIRAMFNCVLDVEQRIEMEDIE